MTGLFALPVLVALALIVRPRRVAALAAIGLGCVAGAGWYLLNAIETGDVLGEFPARERGSKDLPSILARTMRQMLDTIGLPGAVGLDKWLFVAAGLCVLAVGVLAARRGRWGARSAVLAAALTVAPLALLPLERGLVKTYQKLWYALDRPDLGGLDPGRDLTRAGVMFSWYGPVGLLLTIVAAVVVVRRLRAGRSSWVPLVLDTLCGAAMLRPVSVPAHLRERAVASTPAYAAQLVDFVLAGARTTSSRQETR